MIILSQENYNHCLNNDLMLRQQFNVEVMQPLYAKYDNDS